MTIIKSSTIILAIASFQPESQLRERNSSFIQEIQALLHQAEESLVLVFDLTANENAISTWNYDLIYQHMHSCYSHCQAFCTENDKLLLDVSILYYPFCLNPSLIAHDKIFFLDSKGKFVFISEKQSFLQRFQQPPQELMIKRQEIAKFPLVAIGGTFDHLHSGHKILLSVASLFASERIIVGVTDANLLESKQFKCKLQPFTERKERVLGFCTLVNADAIECEIVRLLDAFGPTITRSDIECIVVSEETLPGALEINSQRRRIGMRELNVVVIDMLVRNESRICTLQDKISSTQIREYLFNKR